MFVINHNNNRVLTFVSSILSVSLGGSCYHYGGRWAIWWIVLRICCCSIRATTNPGKCGCFEMQFVFQQMQAFLYTAMVHYICSYNYDFEVFLLPLNPELQLWSKFLEKAQIWDFWGQLVQTESHFKLVLLKCPHSIESWVSIHELSNIVFENNLLICFH